MYIFSGALSAEIQNVQFTKFTFDEFELNGLVNLNQDGTTKLVLSDLSIEDNTWTYKDYGWRVDAALKENIRTMRITLSNEQNLTPVYTYGCNMYTEEEVKTVFTFLEAVGAKEETND